MPVKEALRPGPRVVVAIPVEPSHEAKPLRRCKSGGMDIGYESQKRHQRLAAVGQSELARLRMTVMGIIFGGSSRFWLPVDFRLATKSGPEAVRSRRRVEISQSSRKAGNWLCCSIAQSNAQLTCA